MVLYGQRQEGEDSSEDRKNLLTVILLVML